MATIVEMINPLTGLPEQVDKLDHTAQEIDDAVGRSLPGAAIDAAIQRKPNPNLLDNWYFADPVNQRGQTEYTASGYTIDRWKISSGEKLNVLNGYCRVECTGTAGRAFSQTVDGNFAGKTVTFSALVKAISNTAVAYISNSSSSSIKSMSITGPGLWSMTTTIPTDVTSILVQINPTIVGDTLDLVAAKLELGDQQTLARQDADGNWVLNEIPDHGEQLAKCQRYCQVFDLTAGYTVTAFGIATEQTAWRGLFPIFTKLRAKPVLAVEGENKSLALHGNGTAINISNLTPSIVDTDCNGVGVVYGGLSLTKNQCYVLQAYGCKIILSADL